MTPEVTTVPVNKKLSCRRQAASHVIEYFVASNTLLSLSRSLKVIHSFEMTLLSRACVSPY